MLRSDFLIHWTGRDIENKHKDHPAAKQEEYVARLRNTLDSGLWMNKTKEEIAGGDGTRIEHGRLRPVTCFSEIKLSDVRKHTERYGCLGLGFSRDFVIRRFGAPVQYVSGMEDDIIVENFVCCWKQLEAMRSLIWVISSKHLDVLGEGKVHELHNRLVGAQKALDVNISFIKNMSDPNCSIFPKDFTFLNEAEWRIVETRKARSQGLTKKFGFEPQADGSLKNIKARMKRRGKNYPEALIPFERSDLKVLIFPNPETRKMAFANSDIRQWFGDPPDFPVIATVEECLQF